MSSASKPHSFKTKNIDRMVILKPPKQAPTNKLWKLNKCVYSLADVPRCWCLKLKEKLLKLNITVSSTTQVYSTTSMMTNYDD